MRSATPRGPESKPKDATKPGAGTTAEPPARLCIAEARSLAGWGHAGKCCGIALGLAWSLQLSPALASESNPDRSGGSTAYLYSEADAAMQAGNFSRAKELLQQAWEQSPTFDVAASLADVELRLKDYVSAAEHARFALNHLPASDGEKFRGSIQRVLDEAVKELGLLRITVEPADAELLLDGLPTNRRPFVLPGRHTVTARLKGYEEETHSIKLAALERVEVTFALKKKARPPAPVPVAATSITIAEPADAPPARSGGAVLALGGSLATLAGAIGGGLLASARPGSESNRSGAYVLLGSVGLTLATSVTWQIWSGVTAPPGADRNYLSRTFLAGNSPGEPGGGKIAMVVALHVATAASLGLGVWKYISATTGARQVESETAQQACRGVQASADACLQWQQRAQEFENDRKLAAGMFAGAGVLHLLGMTTAEWWPNVAPLAAKGGGGLTFEGVF
jgi:hypothetical protein